MNSEHNLILPKKYREIKEFTELSGFTMASDLLTGCLLRTLSATKLAANFLELGTGTGLSTSFILDGMDSRSSLISLDNDKEFLSIATKYLGDDDRLSLVLEDGEAWIKKNLNFKFDFIFADTWHGKYLLLDEVLTMLNSGGIYIIDDMLPQPNWPEGHSQKVNKLISELEQRTDIHLTKQIWSSGIIICVKKS